MNKSKQKPDEEIYLRFGDIRTWIKGAKKYNADICRLSFHELGQFDNWCVEITLRKHITCPPDDDSEDPK